jgi:hypothetical protein
LLAIQEGEFNLKWNAVLIATLIFSSNAVFGDDTLTIKFNDTEYMHRWSENTQHEFTPDGQTDLSKWKDMITVNCYPFVKDAEELANVANIILGKYQKYGAKILRTNSLPRTSDRPAEHLIVALFGEPHYFEFVQARFIIVGGAGASIIYSHRIYGSAIASAMEEWIQENGPGLEEKLMSINNIPTARELESLDSK